MYGSVSTYPGPFIVWNAKTILFIFFPLKEAFKKKKTQIQETGVPTVGGLGDSERYCAVDLWVLKEL